MLGNLVKDGLQLSRRMKKRDNVYHRRVLSMSGTWLTAEISSPGGMDDLTRIGHNQCIIH